VPVVSQRGRPRQWEPVRPTPRGSAQPPGAPPDPTQSPGTPPGGRRSEQPPSLRERLATATVPAGALLPIRFFFGVTFVYAGLDKLLDPSFFDPSSPTSIAAQLAEFARVSPLSPLVKASEPFATPMGLLIAFAEIAIGLGALTGLAYRLAALGGAALSLTFWLTASWATHPYYYGADLPYAAGWAALALAGHGGLLVPRWVLDLSRPAPAATRTRSRSAGKPGGWTPRPAQGGDPLSTETSRRVLLQVGVLAGAALALGAATLPLRVLRGSPPATGSGSAGAGASPLASASPRPSAHPGASPKATSVPASPPPGGISVANVSDLKRVDSVDFMVPTNAPSPLPAGDPGVIVKLPDGTYVAYDAVCTHQGCTVAWDAIDSVLLCPCHGAAFDAANQAAVLAGPTRQPLAPLPITVDPATGTIYLTA
jgi:thiosulfate dehydrogenase [quinone] large subunit